MRYIFSIVLSFFLIVAKAQQVESIHFHLYTDSLKKGTHNYINIDGKMSDGSWKPLTSKEIDFKSDYGTFKGNDLVLPESTTVHKVTVTATLKNNPKTTKQIVIWIKQTPDPPLPEYNAQEEIRRKNMTRHR